MNGFHAFPDKMKAFKETWEISRAAKRAVNHRKDGKRNGVRNNKLGGRQVKI